MSRPLSLGILRALLDIFPRGYTIRVKHVHLLESSLMQKKLTITLTKLSPTDSIESFAVGATAALSKSWYVPTSSRKSSKPHINTWPKTKRERRRHLPGQRPPSVMSAMLRGEVRWVNFDPSVGGEIRKQRPAIILSNDAANKYSNRVQVVPLTSNVGRVYPSKGGHPRASRARRWQISSPP